MSAFERLAVDYLQQLTFEHDKEIASMARELIAQRAAEKYRGHLNDCPAATWSEDGEDYLCTCGFDALPGWLKGGA